MVSLSLIYSPHNKSMSSKCELLLDVLKLFEKLQTTVSWKIKPEIKWHQPSNKFEITWFYMGKNSKFTGSFSWGFFMWHKLQWFLRCCLWSPYFFNHLCCGSVLQNLCIISIYVSVAAALPPPTLGNSLLSLLLPPPLTLGSSLPNFCVTDSC